MDTNARGAACYTLPMHRNLVFVSVFNRGAKELAANHLASLNRHGCANYRAYCVDPIWSPADDPDRHLHLDAGALARLVEGATASGAAAPPATYTSDKSDYGTRAFNELSYLRYYVILAELKEGNDVWYMDVDTVVRTNLNDFWAAQSLQDRAPFMFQDDIVMPCTGCMLFAAAGGESVHMLAEYLAFIEHDPHKFHNNNNNDQTAMLMFMHQAPTHRARLQLLERYRFPCGRLFFGQAFVPLSGADAMMRTRYQTQGVEREAWFVHANYMVGIDAKIRALQASGLWYV